ncbi:PstS family phosphate ABC transporter substrate-binding protein [Parafilimonas sp.]|uniref:PstS family phosphate ABC transporter substrate-binding protein n=1 Tax=Parafilimonas sp. TaxID=1969739 RepID=UPI0039E409E1
MMSERRLFIGFYTSVFLCLAFVNCRNKVDKYDSPVKGTIFISVDESFKPVITEQIKVYESSHPETHIEASYKSEADCFRDLQKDSTRMIIVSRGLNEEENEYYKQKLSFKVQWDILAYDAIVAIVNKHSKDSLFTINKLKAYLSGKDTAKLVAVDGRNATSTVRMLKDSLLMGAEFGKNVMAAPDSKDLISYVSSNENAIGFIGFSWVGDEDDPVQKRYKDSIRFGLVECKNCGEGIYARPSQATISAGEYPLVRPLFFVLKENTLGLGSGFVNFLSLERGQLIFRRSYLVPAKMNFTVRKSMMESNTNLINKTTE